MLHALGSQGDLNWNSDTDQENSDSDYLSEQEGEADYTLGSEPSVASGSECMSEPDSETDYLNLCLSLHLHRVPCRDKNSRLDLL